MYSLKYYKQDLVCIVLFQGMTSVISLDCKLIVNTETHTEVKTSVAKTGPVVVFKPLFGKPSTGIVCKCDNARLIFRYLLFSS